MGMIDIRVYGSFDSDNITFGPADYGHANTVAEAIEWLANDVLPKAIAKDHYLQDIGEDPPEGWRK